MRFGEEPAASNPAAPLPLQERRRDWRSGHSTREVVLISSVVALALGTIPSLASGILFAKAARDDLLARQVEGCHRSNDVRTTIQNIMRRQEPVLAQYLKDGTINQQQYDSAIALNHKAVADIAPVKCEAVVRG